MGIQKLTGFRDTHTTRAADHLNENEKTTSTSSPTGSTDSDSTRHGSLVERNEKEIATHPDVVTQDAQLGQQKAEAAALVWSKPQVYATYVWIWVCFFMLALQSATTVIFNPAAYADFALAPEIVTSYVLANIIGGVLKLPIAKILNIWGRAEGFFIFVCVYLLGMIIIAASKGPNAFAAGYTLYWIGFDAVYLIMDIFVADTSGLRNRAFAFAFVSTPFIATAFTGSLLGQAFMKVTTWRWGYGAFVIIQFAVFMPLVVVFKFFQRKAEKQGLFVRKPSGRTMVQSIKHYFHEFDIVGAILLMAAFVLFLLPFSLATYGRAQYHSATFIAMVVVGIILFPVFAIWEAFFTRVQFIRWELFKQRTVLGACCLAAIVYFSFYGWETYFYNFNIVVYNLSFSEAGYMSQIYNVGSTFWGVVFGVFICATKHFKYGCLFIGLPLMMLGAGLMVYFRGSQHGIGYVVMCQIFIAFGGGTLVIGEQMAVMAAADRDGVPMMLSLISLCSNLGGAIGYAVTGAIYNNTFLKALTSALPAADQAEANKLYLGGYAAQILYAPGTPQREAAAYAWSESQKYNCTVAVCILILGIPAIAVWKNYNVDKKQNKGTVI
ncbi:hypothetical protein R6Q59_009881 [Mikania micrantha]